MTTGAPVTAAILNAKRAISASVCTWIRSGFHCSSSSISGSLRTGQRRTSGYTKEGNERMKQSPSFLKDALPLAGASTLTSCPSCFNPFARVITTFRTPLV